MRLACALIGGWFLSQIATLHGSTAMAERFAIVAWPHGTSSIGGSTIPAAGGPLPSRTGGVAADYVRTLAKQYPIDTNRVIAVGHSAGAVLAIWLGAREKVPVASPLYVRSPLKLRSAVGIGADGDLPPLAPALEKLCRSSAATVFLGNPVDPAQLAQANPADMLPFTTPQLLISGTVDELTFDDVGHFEVVAPTSAIWPAVRDAILRVAGVVAK